jgi:hypothetical protein
LSDLYTSYRQCLDGQQNRTIDRKEAIAHSGTFGCPSHKRPLRSQKSLNLANAQYRIYDERESDIN